MTASVEAAAVQDTGRLAANRRVAPTEVFAAALGGAVLTAIIEGSAHPTRLPVSRWAGRVSRGDRFLLDRCLGATVDLGCGPGRLSAALASSGHEVLGVDVAREAVARTRQRGVPALCRNVFDALPREGLWDTALLADGNIGIGGDPVALLRRVRRLVHTCGRVVLDLAAPGTGLRVHRLHLRAGGLSSTTFAWAQLGPDAVERTGAWAGLAVMEVARRGDRWLAVLTPEEQP